MKSLKQFLYAFAFPVPSAQSLAMFVFLVLNLVASMIPWLWAHALMNIAYLTQYGITGSDGRFAELVGMGAATLALLATAWLLIQILLGKLDSGTPKDLYGFSVFLYILGALGAAYAAGPASPVLIYLSILILFAVALLPKLPMESKGAEDPLSVHHSLFAIVISGGFFLYYLYFQQDNALLATVSAYASYMLVMTAYGIIFRKRSA